MKILVTGFTPFGGEEVNPAYEAVKMLPDRISGGEIIKQELPTSFTKSIQAVCDAINTYHPDIIINAGQAGGRSCVTVEKIAINLADASIPDNDGNQPQGEKLKEDGADGYFSLLPVEKAVKHVREMGLPCHISYSAGTYVCNALMYQVLYLVHKQYPKIKAGFVHVPYICQQAVNKPDKTPFMALEDIVKALTWIIEACAEDQDAIQ